MAGWQQGSTLTAAAGHAESKQHSNICPFPAADGLVEGGLIPQQVLQPAQHRVSGRRARQPGNPPSFIQARTIIGLASCRGPAGR
jgi:hypothetical protein